MKTPKISVDSATLANKGLEVIETHFLFSVPTEKIRVLVERSSRVHGLVEMIDSTVLAQFGPVDMRISLQRALLGPESCEFTLNAPLDFYNLGTIDFMRPDFDRFPCLALAYDAVREEETGVYNAADEAAVKHYLRGDIHFGDIAHIIRDSLAAFRGTKPQNLADVYLLDDKVQTFVEDWVFSKRGEQI